MSVGVIYFLAAVTAFWYRDITQLVGLVNMVAALKGVLVKCDPPTMEIIRLLNETRDFIIEQLNEEYVLCRECVFDFLEEEVTKRLELAERQTAELQRELRQARQQQQQDQEE
ncbi:general transcription factor IIH polypeptide 5 GTF2H5 [Besnoitia besnoiti]|uniref:General transcription and DNA repair factor IIH subunit TFB5 n=1 Tax=Besnoitia besnoiti TaxID=94643 RepID=A0A2A9MNX7_BESBE|nr:general transcription factor IIH polypeptide 5 GTF2H5 [Besnoitia besnoiti]PFH37432.1 general transcription factor IIH polypeptide 5 GTF2H5 [Besnoitia besnoiti]